MQIALRYSASGKNELLPSSTLLVTTLRAPLRVWQQPKSKNLFLIVLGLPLQDALPPQGKGLLDGVTSFQGLDNAFCLAQ